MTCIIALKENDYIYLAGDSAAVDDNYSINQIKDGKLFKNGDMYFGFAGSFRMGQLLQHVFKPPKHKPHKTDLQYMCSDFIAALQKCFEKNGFDGESDSKRKQNDGDFIVIYNNNIYVIDDEFQVLQFAQNFTSVGIGECFANASLYTSSVIGGIDPEMRIHMAMESANKFCTGVIPPYNIIKIKIN